MYINKGYVNPYQRSVTLRKHESIDSALRRLKRLMENAGIFDELREREHFVKPSMQNKRRHAAAVKREQRRQLEQTPGYKKPVKKEKEKR